MSKMESLNMNDNRMKTVPDVVCSFLQLKVLDMSNNSVVSLPDGILGLTQLEELKAAEDHLRSEAHCNQELVQGRDVLRRRLEMRSGLRRPPSRTSRPAR